MSRTRAVAVLAAALALGGAVATPLVATATTPSTRVDVPAKTWLCLANDQVRVGLCLNDPVPHLSR